VDNAGLAIRSVEVGSPAEKAGLQTNDIIETVDGAKMAEKEDLSKLIRSKKEGNKIELKILRNNQSQKIVATLGSKKLEDFDRTFVFKMPNGNARMYKLPDSDMPSFAERIPKVEGFNFNIEHNSNTPKLGLKVQDIQEGNGVKVLEVSKESLAEKAGIKVNDIITEYYDKVINNTDEFRRYNSILRNSRALKPDGSYSLKVLRDGKPLELKIVIPKLLKTAEL
jgi:serine protease Do